MRQNGPIQALFEEAVELPAREWSAFLARSAAPEDVQMEVRRLLEHHLPGTNLLGDAAVVTFNSLAREIGCSFGEFRIVRELGSGGMATVYLAEDTVLGREVALKVINSDLASSPPAVERFHREARAAAQLNHPGIVPVYRFGEDRGTHFIAMEYVKGTTLETRIRAARTGSRGDSLGAAGTSPPPDSVPHRTPWFTAGTMQSYIRDCGGLVSKIGRALDFAHDAGVLHRDVKPSNILIDSQGTPRIADFGIAKVESAELTSHTQEAIGTWRYMSPEQAVGETVDRRTDVFSLGVVLYELLTLDHPFQGNSPAEVVDALRSQQPRSLRSINPAIPKDLETICQKALEKNRGDRYPTAGHLAADLECHLRGDPILARPPGVARRATRWIGRHRVGSLASVAVVLVGSLGAAAGIRYQRSVQALAHVNIDTGSPSVRADVYVRAWDHDRRILEPATLLGTAPIANHSIPPGPYRFVVVAERGAFTEFDATLAAGEMFARTVTPTAAIPAGSAMVTLEPGPYTVRVVNPDGTQQDEQIVLDGFMLDITEVSNAQYKEFVDATRYRTPEHWITFGYDEELASRPVVNVTLDDAQAYCSWVGKRLPTATEWEAAARAPDGRLYPWGSLEDTPDRAKPDYEALVNSQSVDFDVSYREYGIRVRNVDDDDTPQSDNGIKHLLGNVMEFTSSPGEAPNIVRGRGWSWANHPQYSNLVLPFEYPRSKSSLRIGFRCARSLSAAQAIGEE